MKQNEIRLDEDKADPYRTEEKIQRRKKVSIITVTLNSENTIARTLESVLSQTYGEIEYWIVDGMSEDRTWEIVQGYAEKFRKKGICYHTVSGKDKGIYDAMNKGIKMATGLYINFMNAGDYFYTNTVIEEIAKINSYNDIIIGDSIIEKNGMLQISKADPFYNYPKLRHKMGFTHQSVFVKTELAKQNPFDYKYKLAADYNMIITLYRKGCKFFYINLPISYYDLNGVSFQKRRQHIYETLCVDNPHTIGLNKIKSYLILYRWNLSIIIKKILKK